MRGSLAMTTRFLALLLVSSTARAVPSESRLCEPPLRAGGRIAGAAATQRAETTIAGLRGAAVGLARERPNDPDALRLATIMLDARDQLREMCPGRDRLSALAKVTCRVLSDLALVRWCASDAASWAGTTERCLCTGRSTALSACAARLLPWEVPGICSALALVECEHAHPVGGQCLLRVADKPVVGTERGVRDRKRGVDFITPREKRRSATIDRDVTRLRQRVANRTRALASGVSSTQKQSVA